jgi:hypothetical protein
MRTILIVFLLPTLAFAQQDGVTGTVSGSVYCADTQQPTRLASVVLVSLPAAEGSAASGKTDAPKPISAETSLDGSFQFPRVPPGDYYISVTQPGYLSPEWQFTAAELLHPTPDVRKRIVESVPAVSVAVGKSATTSVILHRGGAITGVLRYDDGSPVPEVEVKALRRDPAGAWTEVATAASDDRFLPNDGTDDLGHFRIRGLAPGEYTLEVFRFSQGEKGLTVYYGDGFNEKDAKPIKLAESEEHSGADIVIRLAILHSVAGSLVNLSGQVINAGYVALYSVPDNVEIAGATVDAGDPSFRMNLVPEGHYTLRVTNARDVNLKAIPATNANGSPNVAVESVLQSYGNYEAPFVVVGDVTELTLTVPPKAK